jgi:hypothetical protein
LLGQCTDFHPHPWRFGKHLSEGSNVSMIALYRKSAWSWCNKEDGTIIPFNVFYDALHQFLDHSHKGVIMRAGRTTIINPDRRIRLLQRKRTENVVHDQIRQEINCQ